MHHRACVSFMLKGSAGGGCCQESARKALLPAGLWEDGLHFFVPPLGVVNLGSVLSSPGTLLPLSLSQLLNHKQFVQST